MVPQTTQQLPSPPVADSEGNIAPVVAEKEYPASAFVILRIIAHGIAND